MTNNLRRTLIAALAAALVAGGLTLSAQQSVNTTTLSAALSAPAGGANGSIVASTGTNQFVVGSVSNILVGYELVVDSEAMLVTAVNSTTAQVTVQRGYDGTQAASHASGSVVYIGTVSGTPGSPFQFVDPPVGTCALTSEVFGFRVNLSTGRFWSCATNGWSSKGGPDRSGVLGFYSGQAAGTTVTTLLPSQSGMVFVFDAATGNNYKLPVPQAGLTFDFIQTVSVTSNSSEIQTDGSATFIQGAIHIGGVATTVDFQCNGTSHLAIKQNGTTTGGLLGGRLHFTAISGTKWQVDGITFGSGTGATPCSTTT